jgi:pimeloyl-ACP methyl ester carboxylesterase
VAEVTRRANTLSVRTRPKRGSIAGRVQWDGSAVDLFATRLVILVHGFNNSTSEATESYGSMIGQLHRNLPAGGLTRLGPIWEFHWPGDQASRSLPVAMIKGYKKSLAEVERVGELLAQFLARRPRWQRVSIVAHSMGCRVTLEALKHARVYAGSGTYPGARIRGILLLAAAVPVRQCRLDEPALHYATPLSGCAERVLYSRSDLVLRCAFPLGQPLRSPERGPAVGLTGDPALRWRSRSPTGLGHGDYWKSPRVATEIAVRLGIRAIQSAPIEPLPETRLAGHWIGVKKLMGRGLPKRLL